MNKIIITIEGGCVRSIQAENVKDLSAYVRDLDTNGDPVRTVEFEVEQLPTIDPERLKLAQRDGMLAGEADAAAFKRDPENFEPLQPNPFGCDSEPELHEAWSMAHENTFEANR